MATLTCKRDDRTGEVTFTGTMTRADLARIRDGFDLAVIRDCEGEGRTASDFLLAAELIFRRAEEAGSTVSTDLFGTVPEGNVHTKAARAGKSAYPAPPGTGPAGETCKGCAHYCSTTTRAGNTFPKCGRIEKNWTSGRGTDIKARSPACRLFEARAPDKPIRGVLKG